MAGYVGIHPSAWARAKAVDGRMKWERGTTLGKLAGVWKESQELGLEEAHVDDIATWADLRDEEVAARFVARLAAKDVRFLVATSHPDIYVINGNREELAKILGRQAKSSTGGVAKRDKARAQLAAMNLPQAHSEHAPSTAPGTPEAGAEQCPDPARRCLNLKPQALNLKPAEPPLSPPGRGAPGLRVADPPGGPTKREVERGLKTRATLATAHVVGILRTSGVEAPDTLESVLWDALVGKYGSWEGFARAYEKAFHRDPIAADRELEKLILAHMRTHAPEDHAQ